MAKQIKVAAVNENWHPLIGITIEMMSLTTLLPVDTKTTGKDGVATFTSAIAGPHFFKPRARRVSTKVGHRTYTGMVRLQIIQNLAGLCYDHVVQPDGLGTSTTWQGALDAASDNDVIAICPGAYVEDVTIPANITVHLIGLAAPAVAGSASNDWAVTLQGSTGSSTPALTVTAGSGRSSLRDICFLGKNSQTAPIVDVPTSAILGRIQNCGFQPAINQLSLDLQNGLGVLDEIVDCYFFSNTGAIGVDTGIGSHEQVTIRGCTFHTPTGIRCGEDVIITGCYFISSNLELGPGSLFNDVLITGNYFLNSKIVGTQSGGTDLTITNNHWNNSAVCIDFTAYAIKNSRIAGNTFNINAVDNLDCIQGTATNQGVVIVDNIVLNSTRTSTARSRPYDGNWTHWTCYKARNYVVEAGGYAGGGTQGAPYEADIDNLGRLSPSLYSGTFGSFTAEHIAWEAFTMRSGDSYVAVAAGSIGELDASSTYYMEVDSSGTVSVNKTAFTAGQIPLAVITTIQFGFISDVQRRASLLYLSQADSISALAILNEPTGFPNRTDSVLSISTRTFTIGPSNGSFDYYQVGVKYTVSAPDDIIITDVDGVHAIYYDGDTLSESVNPSHATFDTLIVDKVLVGLVYWNATDGASYIVADERHGTNMSGRTHEWLHDAVGAVWSEGLTISGYTVDEPDADASLTFEVTDGEVYDEDIEFEIEDGTPANQYEQQLNGGDAEIPILYREGDPGHWTEDAASTLPYKVTGSGRMAYNSLAGSTYGQTEVTDGKWVSATLIATNDWLYPIKMVQGQAEYADKKTAIEEAANEIIAWGTLPTPEFVVLYRFVMQTKDSYGSTPNAKIVDVTDFRRSGLTGGAAAAQDHGTLSGLADDDHAQYLLADGTRVLTGDWDAGGTYSLKIDTIIESDAGVGVTVEGVKLLDSFIELAEITKPSNPDDGTGLLYMKNDDKVYFLATDGTEYDLTAAVVSPGHAILDGSVHTDSVADGVTRGSLIYGNATPKWDELAIGGAGTYLRSDGTDASWGALADHDHTGDAGDGGQITEASISDLQSYVLAHAMLDGSAHNDSVADAVTRGSLIYGNATPKWDELVVGGANEILQTDGTDVAWVAPATAIGHAILDGSIHTDSVADGVTAGSIIIGNDTPKWDELVISVPAANVLNVLGITNGETTPTWKTVLDGTAPADTTTSGAAGTSLVFSHRDHAHKLHDHDHTGDAGDGAKLDHGAALDGLGDDDHTIYPLLAGRSGGQTLIGDTASGGDLTLQSTAHATRGSVLLGSASEFELDENTGQLKLPTSGSGAGILIGGDVQLYRVSANALAIPDSLFVGAALQVQTNIAIAGGNELRFFDVGDSNYVGFEAPALTGNQIWVLPDADGDANEFLQTDGNGNLIWAASAGAAHAILDGSTHNDSVADAVTRGSLIYGNSTPKWDELVIGGAGTYLQSDGTDAAWAVLANHDHTGDAGDGAQIAGASALSDLDGASGVCGLDANARVDPTQTAEKRISITVENPSASEDIGITRFNVPVTITKVVGVLVGYTSVTINPKHHTDRSNAGTALLDAATAITSTTTGDVLTSWTDENLAADEFLWLETTAKTGTTGTLELTIFYTED